MDKDFANDIYDSLCGLLVTPVTGVADAFEEGSICAEKYEQILAAYERLRQRLGVQAEDSDVEEIIDSFLHIQKVLCLKMLEYGALYAQKRRSSV